MKFSSRLPKHLAFLVRINIYILIIFVAFSLLSVWSQMVSPLIGAATMAVLVPAALLLLILHFAAYFANIGILYIVLTIGYGYFTVSSISSLISGDIEDKYFAFGIFLLYEVTYSLIFAYSAYLSFRNRKRRLFYKFLLLMVSCYLYVFIAPGHPRS